ncbi:YchJ family protein [Pseudaquabacterium terrae]|uniref:YchJ family protein n=1 Tax=Pseudaquabacterium terrae TaxID=2732868 RepID=UPI001C2546FA|nr:YchJ family metal-binding protein [Aquabacterium terrae]
MADANADAAPCPCGRPADYAHCCGRWHGGALRLQAPDAESLMRSRYSAFVRSDAAYLLDTWHPSTRPSTLALEPGLRWLGLEVKRHRPDGDARAIVEFVARSKQGGRAHRLHELSRFVREDGRWFYVDALADPAADQPKRTA